MRVSAVNSYVKFGTQSGSGQSTGSGSSQSTGNTGNGGSNSREAGIGPVRK